jgi:hypothetical protein
VSSRSAVVVLGNACAEHVPDELRRGAHANGNGGHEYGTALSGEQRRDIVAYLKTR